MAWLGEMQIELPRLHVLAISILPDFVHLRPSAYNGISVMSAM